MQPIAKPPLLTKVLKLGLDRMIRPKKPRTIQLYGLFRVKNRSTQKKVGTRTDRSPSAQFYEPWLVSEVRTVSFCFSFFGEFWPIHRHEVMIISRRNERTWGRTKIGRRSYNFRSWTKGFVLFLICLVKVMIWKYVFEI